MITRRNFLPMIGLGAATLAATLSPSVSATLRQLRQPKHLIVVFASGGWDVAYALDAKPSSAFVDTPAGTLNRYADFEILTDTSRPGIANYFAQDASIGVLVRGISTQSFIHEQSSQRVLTGSAGVERPDLAAQIAADLGVDRPIPYLVLGGAGRVGPFGHLASRAGTTNQLATLAAGDLEGSDPLALAGPPGFRPTSAQEELTRAFLDRRYDALAGSTRELSVIDLHRSSSQRGQLLRDFAKKNNGLGARGYTPDLAVQVDVALAALQDGLCQSLFLQHEGWDTHSANDQQSALHDQLFTELAHLSQGLQDRNLLDETLVVVLSEMGRTPKLNESQGKDHWPVSAAWIFGAGIRGGRAVGATNERLVAESIDFQTGTPSATGRPLQTPNLAATILTLCGAAPQGALADVEVLNALLS
jgi:hypothetical protein